MKWSKPELNNLTIPTSYGVCSPGSNPAGGGCANGVTADNQCKGGNKAQLGCGGGGQTLGGACTVGTAADTCGGGGAG